MSTTDTMRALLWMSVNDPNHDPAEFIVRAARPTRWCGARFNPADVERAAAAIRSDTGHRAEVVRDALRSADRAGVRYEPLLAAENAVAFGGAA